MNVLSTRSMFVLRTLAACVASGVTIALAGCATPPPAPPAAAVPADQAKKTEAPETAPTGPIAPFAWLAGCWQGDVNQRDFREQWLPLRGGMLVGTGQMTMAGKMLDYQFLRIEARPSGIVFSQFSGERKELSFKLATTTTDGNDTIFTFDNTTAGFPARLVYRRGAEGWLYETIEGPLNGADKRVIYPLRRVSCETGELIVK
jgi:hypothetical protein